MPGSDQPRDSMITKLKILNYRPLRLKASPPGRLFYFLEMFLRLAVWIMKRVEKRDRLGMMQQGMAPVVDLNRIRIIKTFEIMQADLKVYTEATRRSEMAFGFLTGSGGAFISCGLAWLSNTSDNPAVVATFAAVTVVLFLATLFFMSVWIGERRKIPDLFERFREDTVD